MRNETPTDPVTLGLAALAATLADARRAQRFVDLTGIGTELLRDEADAPHLLAALIRFLEAHEPDLIAVCDAAGIEAQALITARRALEQED